MAIHVHVWEVIYMLSCVDFHFCCTMSIWLQST